MSSITDHIRRVTAGGGWLSLLTFDRLITGQVIHLVYWCGLSVMGVIAFGVIGASVGVAIREGGWAILLAFPVLIVGLLVVAALALIWRAFCEFYVAIFRISDDLAALRQAQEEAENGAAD